MANIYTSDLRGGSALGDIKWRFGPTGASRENSHTRGSEEWLRCGQLVAWDAKYARLETTSVGRRLYAYTSGVEGGVTLATTVDGRVKTSYYGGTYYYGPVGLTLLTKTALGGSATASAATSAITDWLVITSGANAGRVVIANATSGANGVKFGSGNLSSLTAATTSLSITGGTYPQWIAGKPDGSLLVIGATSIGLTYGSGNIYTSTDGGANWTARTSNLSPAVTVTEAFWSASLSKFVFIDSAGVAYTSTDGYTWTNLSIDPYVGGFSRTYSVTDTGTYALVIGSSSAGELWRNNGSGWSWVTHGLQMRSIVANGANVYATISTSDGVGLALSTDHGATWTELGQINGVAPSPIGSQAGGSLSFSNATLYYQGNTGTNFYRFGTTAPTLGSPSHVGQLQAVSLTTGVHAFVRIY